MQGMRLVMAGVLLAGLVVATNWKTLPGPEKAGQHPSVSAAGSGEGSFANSGAPAAQASFLEGLAQLHNFEYQAAVVAFHRAQEIDPGFAMAYWGEAMTHNHAVWMEQDRTAARQALARLGATPTERAAKAGTAREKAYLHAAEVLFGEEEKEARDVAYSEAMGELYRAYPEDADAAAFYALSILGTAHAGRDFAIYMRAAAVLEPVFQKFPHHPGVAHYLIHSYDDPIHAPLGLRAARTYSQIAPSAGHAQHMCSHIFVAMGLWDDVVAANEAATRVVHAQQAAARHGSDACGHYPFWLEYGYLEQGRHDQAKRILRACYDAAKSAPASVEGPAFDPDNTLVGSFAAMRARYLIDTEDWQSEVVGWVPARGQPAAQVTLAFATGLAQARRGNAAAARVALEQVRGARRALDVQLAKAQASDQSYGAGAKILEQQLAALVDLAAGSREAAIQKLQAAAAAEEKMPFAFGPPAVDKPSFELLGETLLAAGRAEGARVAFEKALARTPRRTLALLGLLRAAAASGDAKKAAALKAELRSIWHGAGHLPQEVQ